MKSSYYYYLLYSTTFRGLGSVVVGKRIILGCIPGDLNCNDR
jgi:hypothetical protein